MLEAADEPFDFLRTDPGSGQVEGNSSAERLPCLIGSIAAGCCPSISQAAVTSQLRIPSLTPSQFPFRTTNHRTAGVCEGFERRHHRFADASNRDGRPQLEDREELGYFNLRSNPEQVLRVLPVRAEPLIWPHWSITGPSQPRDWRSTGELSFG